MTAFVFVLAITLGSPLGAVLSMPWREFACWAARYAEEPWGEFRSDVRSAIVASTVANMLRGPKSRAAKVGDFLPFRHREPMGEEEIYSILIGGDHGG